MWTSLFGRCAAPAVAVLALAVLPASAAEPYGYWSVNVAPDGIKLGVIFPDYSPNDFAGLMFLCTPGVTTVTVSADSAKPLRKGTRTALTIIADAERTTMNGVAERSEMDDQTRIVATSTLSDPVIRTLGSAKRIAFAIGAATSPLPVKGANTAVAEFLAKCGAGSALE